MAERDFDLVVFGATGVTGRLVAAHLAERGGDRVSQWAVAGRNEAKVERVLRDVGVRVPAVIAADVAEPGSLTAMAARAKVVLNLVGPYTRYGLPVIQACLDEGAHYVDVCGEIPFVRRIVSTFHRRADAARIKLIQVCGFEALPADFAVLLAAEAVQHRWGERLAVANLVLRMEGPRRVPRLSELLSGGTLQSGAEIIGSDDASAATDPAALIEGADVADRVRRCSPISLRPRLGAGSTVIAPMAPTAFINPMVVQRTAALLSVEHGLQVGRFRYREGIALGGGFLSLPTCYALAAIVSGAQTMLSRVARSRVSVRRRGARVLGSIFPSSGFGPSGSRLARWTWRMTLDGHTPSGRRVRVDVDGRGHPYLSTARMIGEVGLLIADGDVPPERTGCLTPAAALGAAAAPRLEQASVRFALSR